MERSILQIQPEDDLVVASKALRTGKEITVGWQTIRLAQDDIIPWKRGVSL